MERESYLAERGAWVDAYLGEQLASSHDALVGGLLEAMGYALQGGKRIRAILVLEGAELGGERPKRVLPTAAAVECFHAYSLVHDDLPAMDNDTERRGRPTLHVRYGEAAAILVGDSLLPFGFELISREQPKYSSVERVLEVIQLFSEALGWRGLTGGQHLDLSGDVRGSVRTEMHRRKTAVLFEAALAAGAVLAGMKPDSLAKLKAFGTQLGLAYQLVDDVLDGEVSAAQSREQVRAQTEVALALLEHFGARAERLRELTQYLAIRRL
jgi:geranylgeranyl pyrophosphate synthase